MGDLTALPVVLFRVGGQLCALGRGQVRAMSQTGPQAEPAECWLDLPEPDISGARVVLTLGTGLRLEVAKPVELAEISPHHVHPVPALLEAWARTRHVRALAFVQQELVLVLTPPLPRV